MFGMHSVISKCKMQRNRGLAVEKLDEMNGSIYCNCVSPSGLIPNEVSLLMSAHETSVALHSFIDQRSSLDILIRVSPALSIKKVAIKDKCENFRCLNTVFFVLLVKYDGGVL